MPTKALVRIGPRLIPVHLEWKALNHVLLKKICFGAELQVLGIDCKRIKSHIQSSGGEWFRYKLQFLDLALGLAYLSTNEAAAFVHIAVPIATTYSSFS